MLLELHVKNLALIDSAHVEFGEGLNILTGETGAGKSVIIGSVNMALGGKAPKEMIRQGADYALVELVFQTDREEVLEALRDIGAEADEDGCVIISRRITPQRSTSRVNDRTVTAAGLRKVTSLLLDIHGQHEHQSLLNRGKHLEILDEFGGKETCELKRRVAEEYRHYRELQKAMEDCSGDEEARRREADFLTFEIGEIEDAALLSGEEEKLEISFRRMSNSRKITENVEKAAALTEENGYSAAVGAIEEALAYDENLTGIRDMLYDLDSLAEDLRRALSEYLEDQTFDEEEFREVTGRLDLIRNLEQKYGRTVDDVLLALEEKKNRLEVLSHFDEIREKTQKEYRESEEKLRKLCESLTAERKKTAKVLAEKIREKLLDLNFLDVRFEMAFEELPHFTSDGLDAAEFMISANPGEPVRPLAMAASGGELSRIMLAIKTVLAETDEIPTLIFDEIDTGISGRTAQKVSEQLGIIAGKHQVICITHLPQIAAMADRHFEIRKDAVGERTVTSIRELTHDEMCGELARLLGGAEITEAVLQNAREMKALADREKAAHRG